jgi:hypothetical protein
MRAAVTIAVVTLLAVAASAVASDKWGESNSENNSVD